MPARENRLLISQVNWVITDFGMFWKIEAEIFGSLLLIQAFIITLRLRSGQAGNPCLPDGQALNILQPGRDLLVMRLRVFTKIKPA
jgi:hypothetical protein